MKTFTVTLRVNLDKVESTDPDPVSKDAEDFINIALNTIYHDGYEHPLVSVED